MFIVRSERNLIQKAGAGIEPAYTALQAAASPLCHPATVATRNKRNQVGAGDEARTRDLYLGKVSLYQLSYSRALLIVHVKKKDS